MQRKESERKDDSGSFRAERQNDQPTFCQAYSQDRKLMSYSEGLDDQASGHAKGHGSQQASGHTDRQPVQQESGHTERQNDQQTSGHTERQNDQQASGHGERQNDHQASGHGERRDHYQGHHQAFYQPVGHHASGHPETQNSPQASGHTERQNDQQASGHPERQGHYQGHHQVFYQPVGYHPPGHPERQGYHQGYRHLFYPPARNHTSGHPERQGHYQGHHQAFYQPVGYHTLGHPERQGYRHVFQSPVGCYMFAHPERQGHHQGYPHAFYQPVGYHRSSHPESQGHHRAFYQPVGFLAPGHLERQGHQAVFYQPSRYQASGHLARQGHHQGYHHVFPQPVGYQASGPLEIQGHHRGYQRAFCQLAKHHASSHPKRPDQAHHHASGQPEGYRAYISDHPRRTAPGIPQARMASRRGGCREKREVKPLASHQPKQYGHEHISSSFKFCCLPPELLCQILDRVFVNDLLSLKLVCSFFHRVIKDNSRVWTKANFFGCWPDPGQGRFFLKAARAQSFEAALKVAVFRKSSVEDRLTREKEKSLRLQILRLFWEAEEFKSAEAFTWIFLNLKFVDGVSNLGMKFQKGLAGIELSMGKRYELHGNEAMALSHYKAASKLGSGESMYLMWKYKFKKLTPAMLPVSGEVDEGELLQAVRELRSMLTHPRCYPTVKKVLAEYYALGVYGAIPINMARKFTHRLFQESASNVAHISQRGIRLYLRYALVDWMTHAASDRKLPGLVLHMAVAIVDYCLSVPHMRHSPNTLLGGTALVLCSRIDHKHKLQNKDIAEFAQNRFTIHDVAKKLLDILSALGGVVRFLTAADFVSILYDMSEFNEDGKRLVSYIADLCLLHAYFLKYSPAKIAASCVLLTRFICDSEEVWPKTLMEFTGFTLQDLRQCSLDIHRKCLLDSDNLEKIRPRLQSWQGSGLCNLSIPELREISLSSLRDKLGVMDTEGETLQKASVQAAVFLFEIFVFPYYGSLGLMQAHLKKRCQNTGRRRRHENLKFDPASYLVYHEYRKADGCVAGIFSHSETYISSVIDSGREIVITVCNKGYKPSWHKSYPPVADGARLVQCEDRAVGTSDDVVEWFGSSVRTYYINALEGCLLHFAHKNHKGHMVNINIPVSFGNTDLMNGCNYVCVRVPRTEYSFIVLRDHCTVRPLSMAQHVDSCVGTYSGEESGWIHASSHEGFPTIETMVVTGTDMTDEEIEAIKTVCDFFDDLGICCCEKHFYVHEPDCCTFSPLIKQN